jgi:hypothetical protein
MAVDSVGVIYIAFDDGRNGPGNYDIYLSKSTDGGLIFLPDVLVNDTLADTINDTRPALALSDEGDIYVSWNKGFDSLFVSKSTDGGVTFGPDVLVNDSIFEVMYTSIDVDSRGYVHIAWDDRRDINWNIYYSRSTDAGLTFSPNIRVNDSIQELQPQNSPSMCVDDSGMVYAVWEHGPGLQQNIYFTLSTDSGDSMFAVPNVEVDDTDSCCWSPSIAVGDSGKVYVLWNDERNGLGEDAYFAMGKYESGILEEKEGDKVTSIKFLPSFPNPFFGSITIRWQIETTKYDRENLNIKIFDVTGRIVKELSSLVGSKESFNHLVWNGKDNKNKTVAAGVYFIRMETGTFLSTNKVLLVK